MAPALQGLNAAQVAQGLAKYGPNEIPAARRRNLLRIVLDTMGEPMFLLLAGAAGLYLVLGDLGEGLFLAVGATASVGLVIFQEARSERALAALRELGQPRVRAVREGLELRIAARDLVPGDLILIGEGERLPADGVLIDGEVLSVDESALTGESVPVDRSPQHEPQSLPAEASQDAGQLLGGSLVVRGQGVVRVTQTGPRSAVGKIGQSLADIRPELTPLQKTAARLVGWLGVFALAFCGLVVVAYGLVRRDWTEAVLAGVTVAISLVPEEFPMVLAVFLALGSWRLARHRVLVRRSAVIETLGSATVLCVDKTGTLTENRMRIERLWSFKAQENSTGRGFAPDLIEVAMLASAERPVDPMDRAIRDFAISNGLLAPKKEKAERVWPLTPQRLAVVQLWGCSAGGSLAAAKGAPETIFELCSLPPAEVEKLHAVVSEFAEQGLRVLGVCRASVDEPCAEPEDWFFEFLGFIGFADPLRGDVPQALAEARGAGIKVIMVTGDYPATALAVARHAGLDIDGGCLSGGEIAALPQSTLAERLKHVRVFARVVPEQKLRIVEALKADGEVVAMTGDGVNDAPALEAAHIGMAMGQKGTDVAREAADLVLLDDSFASIVGGVRLGRRIFSNLRRALTFVTAIHVPIAGLALGPILLGMPPLLLPMHVVLLELVIDPMSALVFEVEPSDQTAMQRPPRARDEPLFGPREIGFAVIQGLSILATTFLIYWLAVRYLAADQARGLGFVALVTSVLVLALANSMGSAGLFSRQRRVYWAISAAVGAVMVLVFAWKPLAAIFQVSPPGLASLGAAMFVASVSASWAKVAASCGPWPRPRTLNK